MLHYDEIPRKLKKTLFWWNCKWCLPFWPTCWAQRISVAAAGQPTYDLERQPAWCDRVLHSKVSVQRKSCSAAAGATLMVLKNWGRAFSVGEIVLQKHFFSGGTMRYPKICKTDWGLSISLATFPQSLHDFDCLKPPNKLGRWDWDGRRRFHHKCVCPSCERWIPLDIDNG